MDWIFLEMNAWGLNNLAAAIIGNFLAAKPA